MNTRYVRPIFLQILYFLLYPVLSHYSFSIYNLELMIVSWSIYLSYSLIFCTFLAMAKPSVYLNFILISGYIIVTPTIIYFLVHEEYFYLIIMFVTYIPIVLLGVVDFKIKKLRGFKVHKKVILVTYTSFIMLVALTKQPNLEFFTDPTTIYLHRAESQSLLDVYQIKIFTWILTPFFLISQNRSLTLGTFLIVFISGLLMYSVFGHKTLIGFPIGLFFLYKYLNTERVIQSGMLVLLGIGALASAFNQNIISAIFVRRIFFVPAHTSYEWLNIFWNDQPAFWGTVFPLKLLDYYPYSQPLIQIMSEKLGGWPNANFITDVLVNTNILGWFFMLLIGILIKLSSQFMMPSNARMFVLLITLLYLNTGVTVFWFGPLFMLLYVMLMTFYVEDTKELKCE